MLKKVTNNKKGVVGIAKIMLGIFSVVFVMILVFTILNERVTTQKTRDYFDSYHKINSIFQTFLSAEGCIAYGNLDKGTFDSLTYAVLDADKLNRFARSYSDPPCIIDHDFLYSIIVEDIETGEEWKIGLPETDVFDDVIQISEYISIRYNVSDINLGRASLRTYRGDLARFYGALRHSCSIIDDGNYHIVNRIQISYDQEINEFCFKDTCFLAHFPCNVSSFEIYKGDHEVIFKKEGFGVEVIT